MPDNIVPVYYIVISLFVKLSTHFSLVMPDNIERTLVQAFQVDCGLVQAQLGMLPEILTNSG